jgi:hypothetical protein
MTHQCRFFRLVLMPDVIVGECHTPEALRGYEKGCIECHPEDVSHSVKAS